MHERVLDSTYSSTKGTGSRDGNAACVVEAK